MLLLYDITRGVDVAHEARHLRADDRSSLGEGKALLFYSSETEEMAHLCHRVLVMREGRVAAELAGAEADAEAIVAAVAEGACGVTRLERRRRTAAAAAGSTSLIQSAPLLLALLILAGTLVALRRAVLLRSSHGFPGNFEWTSRRQQRRCRSCSPRSARASSSSRAASTSPSAAMIALCQRLAATHMHAGAGSMLAWIADRAR